MRPLTSRRQQTGAPSVEAGIKHLGQLAVGLHARCQRLSQCAWTGGVEGQDQAAYVNVSKPLFAFLRSALRTASAAAFTQDPNPLIRYNGRHGG